MDSKSVADLQISLDANEVWYQILHSLWNKSGIWVIQFPLPISPDGQSLTILRTLHTLVIGASASTLGYRSSLLPVEAHKSMQTVWFEDRVLSGSKISQPQKYGHNTRTERIPWALHLLGIFQSRWFSYLSHRSKMFCTKLNCNLLTELWAQSKPQASATRYAVAKRIRPNGYPLFARVLG